MGKRQWNSRSDWYRFRRHRLCRRVSRMINSLVCVDTSAFYRRKTSPCIIPNYFIFTDTLVFTLVWELTYNGCQIILVHNIVKDRKQ